jgi:hypothetical protein
LAASGLAFLVPASPFASSCAAAGSHSAALVIEHGDGTLLTQCVAFDATSITGEGLLNSSGVAWSGQTFGGFGVAVCAIQAEPARYSTCPGKDSYWAIFVSTGGSAWQMAATGATSITLGSGDALGFRYVPAVGTPQSPPSPAGVCPVAGATAMATPPRATVTDRAGSSAGAAAATPPRSTVTDRAGSSAGAASTAASVAGATAAGQTDVADAGANAASAGNGLIAVEAAVRTGGSGAAAGGPSGPTSGSGSGGLDIGLLAACVVGGGLAGLALLRLIAARRRRSAA